MLALEHSSRAMPPVMRPGENSMAITGEAITAIVASEAGIDPAKLDPAATLAQLDISSIDVASALFELEDRFGIEVDPANIAPDSTLAQFIAHVQAIAEASDKP
jgi:acyl carrier protein